jgi:hypothetical protein
MDIGMMRAIGISEILLLETRKQLTLWPERPPFRGWCRYALAHFVTCCISIFKNKIETAL